MGRSITPRYRVEFSGVRSHGSLIGWTPMGWDSKYAGKPTDTNLAAFVKGYEQSTQPGQCNDHLGITIIGMATIIRQADNVVVAEYVRGNRS